MPGDNNETKLKKKRGKRIARGKRKEKQTKFIDKKMEKKRDARRQAKVGSSTLLEPGATNAPDESRDLQLNLSPDHDYASHEEDTSLEALRRDAPLEAKSEPPLHSPEQTNFPSNINSEEWVPRRISSVGRAYTLPVESEMASFSGSPHSIERNMQQSLRSNSISTVPYDLLRNTRAQALSAYAPESLRKQVDRDGFVKPASKISQKQVIDAGLQQDNAEASTSSAAIAHSDVTDFAAKQPVVTTRIHPTDPSSGSWPLRRPSPSPPCSRPTSSSSATHPNQLFSRGPSPTPETGCPPATPPPRTTILSATKFDTTPTQSPPCSPGSAPAAGSDRPGHIFYTQDHRLPGITTLSRQNSMRYPRTARTEPTRLSHAFSGVPYAVATSVVSNAMWVQDDVKFSEQQPQRAETWSEQLQQQRQHPSVAKPPLTKESF